MGVAPYMQVRQGGGINPILSVSVLNHERAPMLCLQRLDALDPNNWANNNVQPSYQWLQSEGMTAHNTLNGTIIMSP